ncbi:sensor domain-containing protein [Streptomyces sp. RFCAC02]|uniref:sensor histidine kinase n=1 Tax=Streptomyces sp. RFCAC02 TaxID=2499143 RepID=UPI001F0D2E68|nr:sensor domain-containing protein [Streptomyces sp. RFCAC02]
MNAAPPPAPPHAGERAPARGRIVSLLGSPFRPRALLEGAHLLLNLPVGIAGFLIAVVGLSVSGALVITFVGLPLLAGVLVLLRTFSHLERARARVFLGADIAEPDPVVPRAGGRGGLRWLGSVLRSTASWRAVLSALIGLPWGVFSFTVTVAFWGMGLGLLTYPVTFWILRANGEPGAGINVDGEGGGWVWDDPFELAMTVVAGLLVLLAGAQVIRGVAAVERALAPLLFGPSAEGARVRQLETDRAIVVDTSAADLRRIERDLHDGAQARLVALAMDLGLAKEKLTSDPEAAARMVDEAHGEVKLALQELRDLARGIHPAILTDRGLGPSLSQVAARCTVPVRVEVELGARPAEAIEGIAYFTVSELLQNVSKHSGARRAAVEIWRAGDRLMLQVIDDGRGGADPAAGSGLAGLAERLAAVDGMLAVESPAGGPTTVTAALPWRDRSAG